MNKLTIEGKDYSKIDFNNVIADDGTTVAKEPLNAFLHALDEQIRQKPERINCGKERQEKADFSLYFDDRQCDWYNGIVGTYRNAAFDYNGAVMDITLKLTTRFDKPDKPFFMARMILSYIRANLGLHLSGSEIPPGTDDLFRFLGICLFRQRLLAACRQGYYKRYAYFRGNDSHLRGRLNISEHIRCNMGLNNGCVAYEYRENTLDNPLNHLVLHTYEALREEFPNFTATILGQTDDRDEDALSVIQVLQMQAPSYKQYGLRETVRQSRLPVTSPYFTEYEELRKICLRLLDGMELSLYTDSRDCELDDVESMLFYAPDLWELFLNEVLQEAFRDKGYSLAQQEKYFPLQHNGTPMRYQNQNKSPTQREHFIEKESVREDFAWRPDFVIRRNGEPFAVLDAKFQPAWNDLSTYYSYLKDKIRTCIAYASLVGAKLTGVVFPLNQDSNDETYIDVYQIGKCEDAHFLLCGIKIPNTNQNNYSEWEEELERETELFAKMLTGIYDAITQNG